MSQTSVIFFGILLAFLVFITVRGELAYYLWVVGLGGKQPAGETIGGLIGSVVGGIS